MLNPIRVRQSIHIRATPEEVWWLVENPMEATQLLPKGARFELLTDRMDAIGSRWRVVTSAGGKQFEIENEVVEIEKPIRQLLRSTSDRMTGTSHTLLAPTKGGTLMTIEGTARYADSLRTLPDRLLTSLLAPILTRRALKRVKRTGRTTERPCRLINRRRFSQLPRSRQVFAQGPTRIRAS